MLYYVSGPVALLEPGLAVIDCGGVGYGCRVTTYTAAQGVGKKLAQRIILELKEKVGGAATELDFSGPTVSAPAAPTNAAALAQAALQELGYSPAEIAQALKGVDPNATTEDMVRHALRAMVMKN